MLYQEVDVSRMNGLLCVCALLTTPAWTDAMPQVTEEITVTATRTRTETKNLSQEVRIIDRKAIENSGATTADELLQTVPGVLVSRSGGIGSPVSVYLRGGKPGHTVVMVDGIRINDPMSTDRSVDLSSILLDGVDRIEIVYGPAASVYGSDAMAGVINIITARPGTGGTVRLETGSRGTHRASFRWSETRSTFDWWIGGGYLETDGISAAAEADGNTEPDGYANRTVNGGFNWDTAHGTLAMTGMLINANGDLDNFGGPFGDNPFYRFDREETHLRADFTMDTFLPVDGISRFTFATSRNDRIYRNPSEDYPPVVNSTYDGRMDTCTWHNVLQLEAGTLSFGLEHIRETGESMYESDGYLDIFQRQHVGTDSAYVNLTTDRLGLQWNAGLRWDDHDAFGSELTGSIGAVKLLAESGIRLRVHAGTAFKAPSLYQLYSPYGNTELEPEEATSWEAGMEKSLMDNRLMLGLTWFDSSYDQMIDFDPVNWVYINVASASVRGSEIYLQYLETGFGWQLAYNFFHAVDEDTGEQLLRRPRSSITAAFHLKGDRWSIYTTLMYNSSREDLDFSAWPAARITLDSFLLIDLTVNVELTPAWNLYVRGLNLTDETYELVNGFGTLGASWYAGVRYQIDR